MSLLNSTQKYSTTVVAISPHDKLNVEHKNVNEHFTKDSCTYWIVDQTLVMPDFAYSLLGFFRELKQPISINIDSFIKLLKINDVTSIINAFFSADAFATNNFSLKTKPQKPLQHNFIINQKLHKDAIKVAQVLAESETFARTLIATPSNLLNANHLEEICRSKFRKLNNVNISVLHKNDLVRKKMGLILAVGQASPKHNEPRIVVIQYHGDPKKERLAFVGKGLMFDTGGLNLKPSDAMNMMHMDMAGAAITIGTIYALAKLNVKTNVVGVLAITSNEIGPHAYRVNDVVKAYSGSTVEIVNTDAEGRLALADAITYAKKDLKANTVMTVATLTGAIVIALGNVMSGIWASNDKQWHMFNDAATKAPELVWRMPLHKIFQGANIVSTNIADIANLAPGRSGSSNAAAEFLHYFADDINFIHADIAGSYEFKKRQLAVLLKTMFYFAKDFK